MALLEQPEDDDIERADAEARWTGGEGTPLRSMLHVSQNHSRVQSATGL